MSDVEVTIVERPVRTTISQKGEDKIVRVVERPVRAIITQKDEDKVVRVVETEAQVRAIIQKDEDKIVRVVEDEVQVRAVTQLRRGPVGASGEDGDDGAQGPPGTQGEPGVPGTGGDSRYVYDQLTPSATWEVQHDLGKHPSVEAVDSAGNLVYGDVDYVDNNNLIITFSLPFGGKAHLN